MKSIILVGFFAISYIPLAGTIIYELIFSLPAASAFNGLAMIFIVANSSVNPFLIIFLDARIKNCLWWELLAVFKFGSVNGISIHVKDLVSTIEESRHVSKTVDTVIISIPSQDRKMSIVIEKEGGPQPNNHQGNSRMSPKHIQHFTIPENHKNDKEGVTDQIEVLDDHNTDKSGSRPSNLQKTSISRMPLATVLLSVSSAVRAMMLVAKEGEVVESYNEDVLPRKQPSLNTNEPTASGSKKSVDASALSSRKQSALTPSNTSKGGGSTSKTTSKTSDNASKNTSRRRSSAIHFLLDIGFLTDVTPEIISDIEEVEEAEEAPDNSHPMCDLSHC